MTKRLCLERRDQRSEADWKGLRSPRRTVALFVLAALFGSTTVQGQITAPRKLSAEGDPFASLQEQLVNRLRATRDDQQAYIDYVVKQVKQEKLEAKLVVAIERYAMRRNRRYPFPFFERALRYEAAKRGIALPAMDHFASTKIIPSSSERR